MEVMRSAIEMTIPTVAMAVLYELLHCRVPKKAHAKKHHNTSDVF